MRTVPGFLVAIVLLVPGTSHAQSASRVQGNSRIFIDVNVLGTAASTAQSREFESQFVVFGELGSMRVIYPKPSRATVPLPEMGGGFRWTRSVDVGGSFSRTVYGDAANLAATIPDPEFWRASATGTGVTNGTLTRKELAVHLYLAVVPVRTNRTQWRLLAGPSFVSYRADMVRNVSYVSNLTRPQTALTITGIDSDEVTANAPGFHVGSDFEYFLTSRFGITGGMRYDRATVTVQPEPLSAVDQKIRVGGRRILLGVRFHTGG